MDQKEEKTAAQAVAVMGLGYVGLPVMLAFAEHFRTVGFDSSEKVIAGINQLYPDLAARLPNVTLTADPRAIGPAAFILVLVPTPVHADNAPDLSCLEEACSLIGTYMRHGTTVVFESTVYPGATEDICVPLIERTSGLTWKKDFWVAYSPERVNPGDPAHGFAQVTKIVAGDCAQTTQRVHALYEKMVPAGVHCAPSIQVAEAAKILENVQRDVNIALMNEFAMLMDRLGIENQAVLKAAASKWNFLPFAPGLPGGHCIGVDSYYLMHKALQVGFDTTLLTASREINEKIISYVTQRVAAHLRQPGKVNIFGLSFKENVADIRNSATFSLIRQFRDRGFEVCVHDPLVVPAVARDHGMELTGEDCMPKADAVIITVAHAVYKTYPLDYFASLLKPGGMIADIKSILDKAACEQRGLSLWQL